MASRNILYASVGDMTVTTCSLLLIFVCGGFNTVFHIIDTSQSTEDYEDHFNVKFPKYVILLQNATNFQSVSCFKDYAIVYISIANLPAAVRSTATAT